MEGIIRREDTHDPAFGVHQTDNGFLKRGRSDFKCSGTHDFVGNKGYEAIPGLWELLNFAYREKNLLTEVYRQATKILLQSHAHEFNHQPKRRIKANMGIKHIAYIYTLFTTQRSKVTWKHAG
jgi:hypothetical protein